MRFLKFLFGGSKSEEPKTESIPKSTLKEKASKRSVKVEYKQDPNMPEVMVVNDSMCNYYLSDSNGIPYALLYVSADKKTAINYNWPFKTSIKGDDIFAKDGNRIISKVSVSELKPLF